MRFFFDANISYRIARALESLETRHEIRHHDDIFTRGTPDVDWIAELGRLDQPDVVIAGDGRIRTRPHEVAALKEANLTFFLLKSAWLKTPFLEQAWRLVKVWPRIVENAERSPTGTIFEVPIKAEKVDRIAFTKQLKSRAPA